MSKHQCCVCSKDLSEEENKLRDGFCISCFTAYDLGKQVGKTEAKDLIAATKPTIQIGYKDHQEDVIDKVNGVLKPHGLQFEDDMQDHDGFCIFQLKAL
jgi:hypothetical protein